VRSERTILGRW